ncbi:MAG: methyltransferase [Rhodanobacteraceae bacterium]|nr:methyltransferase [Rhodanobacteraceae bacterium]
MNSAGVDHDRLLALAAGADGARLAQLRQRVAAGEPAPYVAGFLEFRGRRFASDRRAYITDPEASHLIDTVNAQGRRLEAELGRPLRVLEFGVGAGTLAITLKLENPQWSLGGLDIDPPALELGRENARAHDVAIELLESDYLSGWPASAPAPDLMFADPPWGDAEDLYDEVRDEAWYRQMPERSAFPTGGGRTTIHDELIRRFAALRWTSLLILNYGILPRELIERSVAPLSRWQMLHPRPDISVVAGYA